MLSHRLVISKNSELNVDLYPSLDQVKFLHIVTLVPLPQPIT